MGSPSYRVSLRSGDAEIVDQISYPVKVVARRVRIPDLPILTRSSWTRRNDES